VRRGGAILSLLAVSIAISIAEPALAQSPAETSTEATEPEFLSPDSKQIVDSEQRGQDAADRTSSVPAGNYVTQLIKMVLMLGAVCVLAYLLLGKLLPRAMSLTTTGRRAMLAAPSRGVVEVVDRLALDQRRALLVVRVGQELFLVGLADQGISLLSRLDPESVGALPDPSEEAASFLSRFQGILKQRMDKEG
jgi:flagellar biogenesis protein FliO